MTAVGTHTVVYSCIDDAGLSALQARRHVLVQDTTAPNITLLGADLALDVSLNLGPVLVATLGVDMGRTSSAVDILDGSVPVSEDWSAVELYFAARNTSAPGTSANVLYTCIDRAGNRASASRKVTLVDRTPPVVEFNVPGPIILNIVNGTMFKPPPHTRARDIVDGDLSDQTLVMPNMVDRSTFGNHTLKYSVKDSSANEGAAQRHVIVTDLEPPNIKLVPARGTLCSKGVNSTPATVCHNYGVPWSEPGISATDNHLDAATLRGRLVVRISPKHPVSVGYAGRALLGYNASFFKLPLGATVNITYSVSDVDARGFALHIATAERRVLIVDTLPPILKLVGPATQVITVGGMVAGAAGKGQTLYADQGIVYTDLHDWPTPIRPSVQAVRDDVPETAWCLPKCPQLGIVQRSGLDLARGSDARQPFPTAGEFNVTYTVVDTSGNRASIRRTLLVVEPQPSLSSSSSGGAIAGVIVLILLCAVGGTFAWHHHGKPVPCGNKDLDEDPLPEVPQTAFNALFVGGLDGGGNLVALDTGEDELPPIPRQSESADADVRGLQGFDGDGDDDSFGDTET